MNQSPFTQTLVVVAMKGMLGLREDGATMSKEAPIASVLDIDNLEQEVRGYFCLICLQTLGRLNDKYCDHCRK